MIRTFFRSRTPKVFDFHGGIHPPEMKHLSNGTEIAPGPLPAQLILPLNMHIGAPAKPLVEPGDRVLKGQMIAEPAGAVSAAIHAPTSGTVSAIGPRPIQHPSGMDAICIVIDTDGRDEWIAHSGISDYTERSPGELVDTIRYAGIAGMGGAGFPTSIKVNLGDHQRVEELVINAVECEPYITADDRLMRERADEIITGIHILQYLLNPRRTLIGIEDNKPEAIKAIKRACKGCDIEIRVVPTKYPSGGEKQLIQLVTGKEVKSGQLPAHVGVVCQNVGTAYAIKRAVINGEPLIQRVTTLTGDGVSQPGNYEVLIGTPVSDLLHHGGVDAGKIGRLVMGGPMMGFTLHSPTVPMVKTTNCIIAASPEELPEPPPEQPCIRCGSCAEVCPANLLPQQLYWHAKNDDLEKAQHHNLMDCIECGACAYVCPSHIPLVQYYRYAKGAVRQQAADQLKADKARQRFEARQARIDAEKAEKEARRQARLEANRKKKEASAAPTVDTAALKQASLEASKAYKAAVKAAKAADAEGAANAAELKAEADRLKEIADKAKAAVRDAGSAAPAAVPAEDVVAKLKKQVGDASSAYKAAVKAAKEAEANGDDSAAALRAQADELKASADKLKAELRDAKAGAPAAAPTAAQADPVSDLKKQVGEASSAYKAAVKTAKEAEENGADNAAELRSKADELKAAADQLKAELRDAKANAPAAVPVQAPTAPPADPLTELKKKVGEVSAAYKAAVKAAKEAEENGAGNAAELRAEADTLKADADHWKAELRDAKAAAPAVAKAPPVPTDQPKMPEASAPQALTQPLTAVDPEAAAKRQKRLKGLKTAYNMAHKQYKEAHAALERAERKEEVSADELIEMQRKVDKLKNKADVARDALDALIEEAKADIRAHTGKDLKTLKLEAARAESALADKKLELDKLASSSGEDALEALNSELKALEAEAQIARKALKQALEEQGLVE
ncbi:electron transport complex protein RnfC [Alcanivorax nanhaiticus]|uniref:Ion-translocating oxidoreductase complex subunit C n=1 Tax=Alcanivorax nanhaiticus TaxID=1177154 RepID=A0A095UVB1_9GAMM|nr:electron transport complex subunit RsxC [Alcanivorax nanhaiticus]KGD66490.1 electron transport complex protein RnfC [Alcanivorax nanhaiticus]